MMMKHFGFAINMEVNDNMLNLKTKALTLLLVALLAVSVYAQKKDYEGPQDSAGDVAAEKIGWMEGNAVRCQFRNTTELSDWGTGTDPYATKWPNDFRGSDWKQLPVCISTT